jgi:hypothetical protein
MVKAGKEPVVVPAVDPVVTAPDQTVLAIVATLGMTATTALPQLVAVRTAFLA